MSDRVKPWDTEDLRKILAEDSNVEIDALPKDDWIGEFSKDELESVLEKATFDLWLQVAKSSHISSSWLEAQSNTFTIKLKEAIAKNPKTPPAVLERLARDNTLVSTSLSSFGKKPIIQLAVASNPSTPVDILTKLASLRCQTHSLWDDFAYYLVHNPSCPTSILETYASGYMPGGSQLAHSSVKQSKIKKQAISRLPLQVKEKESFIVVLGKVIFGVIVWGIVIAAIISAAK